MASLWMVDVRCYIGVEFYSYLWEHDLEWCFSNWAWLPENDPEELAIYMQLFPDL